MVKGVDSERRQGSGLGVRDLGVFSQRHKSATRPALRPLRATGRRRTQGRQFRRRRSGESAAPAPRPKRDKGKFKSDRAPGLGTDLDTKVSPAHHARGSLRSHATRRFRSPLSPTLARAGLAWRPPTQLPPDRAMAFSARCLYLYASNLPLRGWKFCLRTHHMLPVRVSLSLPLSFPVQGLWHSEIRSLNLLPV